MRDRYLSKITLADGARGLRAEAEVRISENRFNGFISCLSRVFVKPG